MTDSASPNSTYPTPLDLPERWSRISRMSRTVPACQPKKRGVREGPTRALSPAREGEGEGERLVLGLRLGLG